MTLPAVRQTEIDGALGVLPPNARVLAIVGQSSAGPLNTAVAFGRVTPLTNTFGRGPMVEAAARHIARGGVVVCARTDKTTDGAASAVTLDGTGTSVPTFDGTTIPLDDFEVYLVIVHGGTKGTAGITFQYSLDGGRTLSPVTALGTADHFTFPDDGNGAPGVRINFAAGTLDAGDVITCRTTAPKPNGTQLGAAIDALRVTQIRWELVHIAVPLDTTLFDAIGTAFDTLVAAGKMRAWIGSVRIPNEGEADATYQTSVSGAFAAKATKFGELCAGACEITSGVSRRKYLRPVSFAVASEEALVDEHIDIANVTSGPLSSVSIVDEGGNPKHHDEFITPGLDDARFTTLRTWEGRQGVYVSRPRIFSAAGSDFELMPLRRVMNLFRQTTRAYFEERLSKEVLVDANTGFILEEEAVEIENGANARVAAVLGPKKKASGWRVTVARDDNLLSTKTMHVTDRLIPVAYVEFIEEESGFANPALNVVPV